jgi:hypothetical protein
MDSFTEHGDYDPLTKDAWIQLTACAVPPLFWKEYKGLIKIRRRIRIILMI